ncbi:MAG TPA: chalcone isomerase family protein [Aquabacterium sp.]|nr:chalcone isomerase family protein [Aquabacterium sp.]
MSSVNWIGRTARRFGVVALSLGLTAGLGLPLPACAASEVRVPTLEGQQFERTMGLADRNLRLNGLGLRGVAWIKAFVAGLYLPAPSKDAAQVLAMPGPKRIRLKIMLNAPSHELTRSLVGRIEDHESEAVRVRLGDRLTGLASLIDSVGDLKPGDTLDLDFIPDKGVSLRFNDKVVGQPVSGDDLYRCVLKIFVGDHPVDRRMKEGLLRGGY